MAKRKRSKTIKSPGDNISFRLADIDSKTLFGVNQAYFDERLTEVCNKALVMYFNRLHENTESVTEQELLPKQIDVVEERPELSPLPSCEW